MFSNRHHEYAAAERESRAAPQHSQTTAGAIQRAQAALAANRVPAFRAVLTETLTGMQYLIGQHAAAQRGRMLPDQTAADALVAGLQPSLAFMQAVAGLDYDAALVCYSAFGNAPLTKEQRAIFERNPALKAWGVAREAKAAAIDAGNAARSADLQASMEAEAAARERQIPVRLLAELHARGVTLAVNREGAITASPIGALLDEHRAALRHHKPAMVALLHAQAEAAKPVAVA